MNFAGCVNCGYKEVVKIVNRQETKDEGAEYEELITYQRT